MIILSLIPTIMERIYGCQCPSRAYFANTSRYSFYLEIKGVPASISEISPRRALAAIDPFHYRRDKTEDNHPVNVSARSHCSLHGIDTNLSSSNSRNKQPFDVGSNRNLGSNFW